MPKLKKNRTYKKHTGNNLKELKEEVEKISIIIRNSEKDIKNNISIAVNKGILKDFRARLEALKEKIGILEANSLKKGAVNRRLLMINTPIRVNSLKKSVNIRFKSNSKGTTQEYIDIIKDSKRLIKYNKARLRDYRTRLKRVRNREEINASIKHKINEKKEKEGGYKCISTKILNELEDIIEIIFKASSHIDITRGLKLLSNLILRLRKSPRYTFYKWKGTAKEKARAKKRYFKDIKKYKARRKARYYIEIPNQLCEICNERKATERHHEDYDKPLEVRFVCSRCNKKPKKDKIKSVRGGGVKLTHKNPKYLSKKIK